MNILIDFTQIPIQKMGMGVYTLNLILNLIKIDDLNRYYILIQDDDTCFDHIKKDNFYFLKVRASFFRKLICRFFLEQLCIPYFAFKYKIDVIHSLHYSFPLLTPVKKVVTIPDMTFFKFPEKHVLVKRYYFRFFIRLAAFMKPTILTISESTKKDFLEKFKIDSSRVLVTYLGKSDIFKPGLDPQKIKSVKEKYHILQKYILFIGTIEPRKNIRNLVMAYQKLVTHDDTLSLVIVGKKGWYCDDIFKLVDALGISERVIFTGFIEEEEKPYLLNGAEFFVYPSIYEGFGIPVLEALSCGIPTITSNVSSLPEVTGDAALLIDPLNVDQLYTEMRRLLEDKQLYKLLKEKSLKQAAFFSWENTATDTLRVYRYCIGEQK